MPDYYDVIKNPRDLGTIKKNLIRKKYETPQEFYEVLPRIGSHPDVPQRRRTVPYDQRCAL